LTLLVRPKSGRRYEMKKKTFLSSSYRGVHVTHHGDVCGWIGGNNGHNMLDSE